MNQPIKFNVIDNTKINKIKNISPFKKLKYNYLYTGVVIKLKSNLNLYKSCMSVNLKDIYYYFITSLKNINNLKRGYTMQFKYNTSIILDKQYNPIGNRILKNYIIYYNIQFHKNYIPLKILTLIKYNLIKVE